MLVSCWVRARLLDALSGSGVLQLGNNAAKPRLQPPLLWGGQLLGDEEAFEVHQGVVNLIEACLQRGGGGGHRSARRR